MLLTELKSKICGEVKTDLVTRLLYSTDASMFEIMPMAVVYPKNSEDVISTVLFAKKHNISVTARGAGTGLAGESLDDGIILDFSVHLNQIHLIDSNDKTVSCSSGVIQQHLNEALRDEGLVFGPDPATSSRCTLGGMIANNSTGAHSLKYGMTRDWIKELTIVLDDGSLAVFKKYERDSEEFQRIVKSDSREGQIYRELIPLLEESSELIKTTWPNTPRNRHGYLLKDVLTEKTVDLTKLFCGSEGTLGLLLNTTLEVSQKPQLSYLSCIFTKDRFEAAKLTPILLKSNPSALELLDEICLDFARQNEASKKLLANADGALLLVEYSGDSRDELLLQIDEMQACIVDNGFSPEVVVCDDKESYDQFWTIRKHVSGAINRLPEKFQPIPIIEDVCVPPERLYEYFCGVEKVLKSYGLKFLCFGHAGDGTAHVRPFLDIHSVSTFENLPEICTKFYEMCMQLGGSISGEHGDGLLRAPFMEMQYGKLVPVFKKIKQIFDPAHLFNPMKKTGFPGFDIWSQNLRYLLEVKNNFLTNCYQNQKELVDSVSACNGCGACRAVLNQDMCPIFRLFGEEIAAPRTKANIWRGLLKGKLTLKEIEDALEYCLGCGMCAHDCPAGVDSARLVTELRSQLNQNGGVKLVNKMLGLVDDVIPFGAKLSVIANPIGNLEFVKQAGEVFAGITSKRENPMLKSKSFLSKVECVSQPDADTHNAVAIFVDTFGNWFEHEILEALVRVLEHFDIKYYFPKGQVGCGIIPFNYGDLNKAKTIARKNLEVLEPFVNSGCKIISTESTAVYMLKEKYPQILTDGAALQISSSVFTVGQFLSELEFSSIDIKDSVAYHAPCHLKSLDSSLPFFKLLLKILGDKVVNLDSGCCGMAGTYGLKKEHYEHSLKIGEKLGEKLNAGNYQVSLSECSTCRMQMKHLAPHIDVMHPIVYLANQL
jgi:FAD/FMN-containing dehydrogenase/Fe-S oxidoreductase